MITATEVVPIQFFSLAIVSQQKIKMKTRNNMAPLHHSKFTSTQNKGVSRFFCLAHRVQ